MASFLIRQLFDKPVPLPTSARVEGKTALITGANVGLGFEVTRELIQHGLSRVILAVRDTHKGAAAKAKLQEAEKGTKCEIEVWELDQNTFSSIAALAKRASALDRLDIVILNAGVMKRKYIRSEAWHELSLKVNDLSTALLSLLLLPSLKQTAQAVKEPARLTFVTSELHMWTAFKQRSAPDLFARLDDASTFSPELYHVSKLLGVFWATELAAKTDSSDVVINAVNPGLCWSTLHRDQENFGFTTFKKMCAWSAAQGGHCLADAAVAKGAASHGKYLSEQKIKP